MLAYLEGRVLERTENSCVLVTSGGVGYEIFLPEHALAQLPAQGGTASFYTSFIVREDAQELFGFPSWDERQTFNLLTGINRVGARTALAILSRFRPDDLRRIVLEDDVQALTRVSGIGKKTAEHVFLELKYKLKVEDCPALAAPNAASPPCVYGILISAAMLCCAISFCSLRWLLRSAARNAPCIWETMACLETPVSSANRPAYTSLAVGLTPYPVRMSIASRM